MMVGMADVTVARNEGQFRYEALIDGEVAGFAQFRSSPGRAVFWHTEVDPAYAGKGVGSTLVRAALDDVRARGEKVVAQCTFIAAYVKRHPEYADLVVED
jgi:predicted GNAT family acetyltransferase